VIWFAGFPAKFGDSLHFGRVAPWRGTLAAEASGHNELFQRPRRLIVLNKSMAKTTTNKSKSDLKPGNGATETAPAPANIQPVATAAPVKPVAPSAPPAQPKPSAPQPQANPTAPQPQAKAMPQPATPQLQAKPAAPLASRISLELVKTDAKQVCVAGSFNGWKPETTPLTQISKGRWVGNLSVKPGRHEYLFVVDGQWLPDPNAKETVQNPFGGKNSVLIVSE